eukprot:303684_1
MVGLQHELKAPKIIGIQLNGTLNEWCSPKMVILKVSELLTVSGGTGSMIEYFGSETTLDSISCTGMATICNMGAEIGATSSVFQYSASMADYLHATNRGYIADVLDQALIDELLTLDPQFDPLQQYDAFYEINLSELKPSMNGPYTPDLRHELGSELELIGSCTNSSYEDLSRVAFYMRQAQEAGLKAQCPLYVSPGSEQIRGTMKRDGMQDIFEGVGAIMLGIGQWRREPSEFYDPNKANDFCEIQRKG